MVNSYIGKELTAKRSRAVSREIAPVVNKLFAEGPPPITRKKGGRQIS
jgi:hypothetical protein